MFFGDASGSFRARGAKNNDIRSGIIDSVIRSDGQYRSKLYCDGGPSMQPRADSFINMDGKEVYKHAVEKQTIIVEELLDSADSGLTLSIGLFASG